LTFEDYAKEKLDRLDERTERISDRLLKVEIRAAVIAGTVSVLSAVVLFILKG